MTEKIVRPYSPEAVAEWLANNGKSAYDAYAEHADWTTYDGRPMPQWDDLTDAVRGHWEWTAMYIRAMVIKSEVPDGA
jgi:hypothetical protein